MALIAQKLTELMKCRISLPKHTLIIPLYKPTETKQKQKQKEKKINKYVIII